jgi:DNA-binding SARP family transcriptional activator
MLWDIPDDPRAALRWSLSKLRAALDRPGAPVVVADRETVTLDLRPEQVDYLAIRETLRDGLEAAATADLEALATRFRGPFLADLDPPQNPELRSWLAGAREEMRRLQSSVLTTLADRHATQAERALPYARELVQLDPFVESSWTRLIERLATLGRRREAEEQYAAAKLALAEVGGATHLLDDARRAGQAAPDPAPSPRRPNRGRRSASAGRRTASAWPTQSPARGRRW